MSNLFKLTVVHNLKGDSSHSNVDDAGQLRVGAAIGVYDDAFSRLEQLSKEKVDVVVIDTAHGDSKPVIETLRKIIKDSSSEATSKARAKEDFLIVFGTGWGLADEIMKKADYVLEPISPPAICLPP